MNKNRFLVFISFICAACTSHKEKEVKTMLIDGGINQEEIQILNGSVKEVIAGDSVKLEGFNHIYFDRKGNMTHANAKYISYHNIVNRKVTYQSNYNKAGKKIEMSAHYSVYPDSCGCSGNVKWTFDSIGRVSQFVSSEIRVYGMMIDYKYDKSGRLAYKNSWGKKADPDRYDYKYDSSNHLIQMLTYESGVLDKNTPTRKSSFKYLEFDSHNNWIKMIDESDTITRKIIYY